jgi:hypothetical protein
MIELTIEEALINRLANKIGSLQVQLEHALLVNEVMQSELARYQQPDEPADSTVSREGETHDQPGTTFQLSGNGEEGSGVHPEGDQAGGGQLHLSP